MPRRSRFVDVIIPETGRVESIARSVAAEFGLTPIGENTEPPEAPPEPSRLEPVIGPLMAELMPGQQTSEPTAPQPSSVESEQSEPSTALE
jgi:hypothetical protein